MKKTILGLFGTLMFGLGVYGQTSSILFGVGSPPAANITGVTYGRPTNPGAGNTLYYWVATNYATGSVLNPNPQQIDNVNVADPSIAQGLINVTWNPVQGAISYSILRTTSGSVPTIPCTCLVATTPNTFVADVGNTLGAFSPTLAPPARGSIRLNNTLYQPPSFEWEVNGVVSPFASNIYTPPFPGGIPTTVPNILNQIVYVADFGVKCDGVTNDAPALNVMTLAFKSDLSVSNVTFVLPTHSICAIASPINIYTAQILTDLGRGTTIKALSPFTGTRMVTIVGNTVGGIAARMGITGLHFDDSATTGLIAIQPTATSVVNSWFRDLTFNTQNGLIMDTYTQSTDIYNIESNGPTDVMLTLAGNANKVWRADKEGGTGSAVGCYVNIGKVGGPASTGNIIQQTIVEGTGSINKAALCINNANSNTFTYFDDERSATNGTTISFVNSNNNRFYGYFAGPTETNKITFTNSFDTVIERLDVTSTNTVTPINVVVTDVVSTFTFGNVYSRYNIDTGTYANLLAGNSFRHNSIQNLQVLPRTGFVPIVNQVDGSGSNLLLNGSFEAGRYGWTFTTVPTTENYSDSQVDTGLMGVFTWAATASVNFFQFFTPTAAMVGQPMTISARVKITGAGNIFFRQNGAGISQGSGYSAANADTGWQSIALTIIPQSTAAMQIGLVFSGMTAATTVYVDDVVLNFGTVGTNYSNKMGSFELGGAPLGVGGNRGSMVTIYSAAPTTGTWLVGDIVYNSSPTATTTPGWVCTTGGTPGTWTPMGILGSGVPIADVSATGVVTKINGTTLSGLATGILKNTTGTGVPSIATAGTDYAVSYSGTTGSIGGSALTVGGACASGTATATGATTGMPVVVSTSDGSAIGSSYFYRGEVTSSNTVTVYVCAALAGTPASKTYNVRVIK
jgi:hypothetical protein